MSRSARTAPGGLVYHALNRAAARLPLFHKPADYDAFERIMREAMERHPTRLLAYCLMPNHWHLVLCPRVQPDAARFLSVCRYVEANPRRAGLVARAEAWPWSSLAARPRGDGRDRPPVAAWPVERPADWAEWVNEPMLDEVVADLRASVNRGRPFGEAGWVATTVERLGLTHTLRGPGRPRKRAEGEGNQ